MLEAFEKYVNNYDMENRDIKLKYNHSYRVMELSRKYATKLGFSKHDVELATLIGLLHDFGRFEQLRVYNSYNDLKTVDHADYSVEQLFDKGEIKDYTDNEEDYEIIKFAIKYHNKHSIPNVDNERMLMHAKLIRDTDKLDIIYLMGTLHELNLKATDDSLTKEVLECIKEHKTIDKRYSKTKNDRIAVQFAFAFDIYNDVCLEELKENYKEFYKQIDGEDIFKDVYEEVIKYIDERIGKYVRN